uniref:Putative secreted protein n=1 Tax=Anopheles darlingi TaxID=43151 RepID=A0A2M4D9I0_ANODA
MQCPSVRTIVVAIAIGTALAEKAPRVFAARGEGHHHSKRRRRNTQDAAGNALKTRWRRGFAADLPAARLTVGWWCVLGEKV